MLTIKRRHRTIRAITAGSLAFAVGLSSVAAYMNERFESQNVVFNKEQTVSKHKPTTQTATQSASSDSSGTGASTTGASSQAPNATFVPAAQSQVSSGSSQQSNVTPASLGEVPGSTPSTAPDPIVPAVETPDPTTDPDCILDILGTCALPN